MKDFKLIHDPGHGGSNLGTQEGGINEKELILEIATDIRAGLSGWRYLKQSMTRIDDRDISFKTRAEKAKMFEAQLALIYHINASSDPGVDGLTTFVMATNSVESEVAQAIMRAAPYDLLRSKTRPYIASPTDWTRRTYNCMIEYDRLGIPSVLIEFGFATSPIDAPILISEHHRPAMVACVGAGVARAMELINGVNR